jgi:flagellum-specific peptidoglycan hydrolase FlgJ
MKQRVFNILISFAVGVLGAIQVHSYLKEDEPPEIKVVHIVNEEQPDFFSKSPQEGLIEVLEYYGVKHPQIVYAQAVLESNWFKSGLCVNGNNLFGLYNSKERKYHTFDHWAKSVEAYVKLVQYKYKGDYDKPPDEYYKFLENIGYAEDTLYISKLRRIVNQLK